MLRRIIFLFFIIIVFVRDVAFAQLTASNPCTNSTLQCGQLSCIPATGFHRWWRIAVTMGPSTGWESYWAETAFYTDYQNTALVNRLTGLTAVADWKESESNLIIDGDTSTHIMTLNGPSMVNRNVTFSLANNASFAPAKIVVNFNMGSGNVPQQIGVSYSNDNVNWVRFGTYPASNSISFFLNYVCGQPLSALTVGDPIIKGFLGQEFEFLGQPGSVYNWFSMPGLQVNALIERLGKDPADPNAPIFITGVSVLFGRRGEFIWKLGREGSSTATVKSLKPLPRHQVLVRADRLDGHSSSFNSNSNGNGNSNINSSNSDNGGFFQALPLGRCGYFVHSRSGRVQLSWGVVELAFNLRMHRKNEQERGRYLNLEVRLADTFPAPASYEEEPFGGVLGRTFAHDAPAAARQIASHPERFLVPAGLLSTGAGAGTGSSSSTAASDSRHVIGKWPANEASRECRRFSYKPLAP